MIVNTNFRFDGDTLFNEDSTTPLESTYEILETLNGEFISPTGNNQFLVRAGKIYCTGSQGIYGIDTQGYIRGPVYDGQYRLVRGFIYGPDTRPPFLHAKV